MRNLKYAIAVFFLFLLSSPAHAGTYKLAMQCSDLEFITIGSMPPDKNLAPGSECKDGCYYPVYCMTDNAAAVFNKKFNENKKLQRDVYLGGFFLFSMEPFSIDMPYTKVFSGGKLHKTLNEAVSDARQFCPDVTIKVKPQHK